MAEGKSYSGMIQIAIALIGLVGSLGVAWITTGAKFESELKENQASVTKLQSEIETIRGQLNSKIDEANKQLAEMRDLLASARKENETLLVSINDLKTQIEAANKTVLEAKAVDRALQLKAEQWKSINPNVLKRPGSQ